jgi:hypothetical protein
MFVICHGKQFSAGETKTFGAKTIYIVHFLFFARLKRVDRYLSFHSTKIPIQLHFVFQKYNGKLKKFFLVEKIVRYEYAVVVFFRVGFYFLYTFMDWDTPQSFI